MDSDLNIVKDEPGLLVLRRNRLPRFASYLFGATLVFLGSLGVNASVAGASWAGRALGLLLVGASVAVLLVNVWRLAFALWTTTTFRASADRIETRIGGLLNARTRWTDPRCVHVRISTGQVIFRNDDGFRPMPFCEIDLAGGIEEPGHRLRLGRVKPAQGTYLSFRIAEMLGAMRKVPTVPPAP